MADCKWECELKPPAEFKVSETSEFSTINQELFENLKGYLMELRDSTMEKVKMVAAVTKKLELIELQLKVEKKSSHF